LLAKNGFILNINELLTEVLGYSEEDLLGKPLEELLPPVNRAALIRILMFEEGVQKQKITCLRKDASITQLNVSTYSFTIEQDNYTILFTDTYINSPVASQTLFKSQSLLEIGERLAKLGAWTLDVTSGLVEWSPGTYDIHEVPQTIAPNLNSALRFYHPNDVEIIRNAVQKCINNGDSWDLELRIHTANGKLKWTRSISQALYEGDKVTSIFGIFQDITEQKALLDQKHTIDQIKASIIENTSDSTGRPFLQDLARSLKTPFDAKCAMIETVNSVEQTATTIGFWVGDELQDNITYPLADTPCANVANGELCLYKDSIQQQFPLDEHLKELDAESYVGTPLLSTSGKVLGLAAIIDSKPFEDGELVRSLFSLFSGRAAAELERLATSDKLLTALKSTVQAIALTIEQRDPYTAGHQRRVAILAEAIAKTMHLRQDQIEALKLGAAIHDIGKISIAAEILNRPGKLGYLEYELIKTHSVNGFEIVKDIEFPWPLADMILQHHERMDGSGYPNGLKGDDIILEARILGVADVVEAMTSHRPYRTALGLNAALTEIDKGSGTIYDSTVVAACHEVLSNEHFKW